MTAADIVIQGAREHNLQSVDVVIPRHQLVCLTGVSGSGKSSLAFDTLYAEGQRRYVTSLSSFARQFLGQMPKPEVDQISGLSPSISIAQKSSGQNPRSTVGTMTEIYDFLRVLYARVGKGYCPTCGAELVGQSREQIIDRILALPAGTKYLLAAPVVRAQKGEFRDFFEDLLKQGYLRARVDGELVRLENPPALDRQRRHTIEVVLDRLTASAGIRGRVAEAVDAGLKLGEGDLMILPESTTGNGPNAPSEPDGEKPSGRRTKKKVDDGAIYLSSRYSCVPCGVSYEPPSPQLFSFNSPRGMCHSCQGLGEIFSFVPELLIPNPKLSIKQGAIDLFGKWGDIGRWRRHVYEGVAETLERVNKLEAGYILSTPWQDLPAKIQQQMLYGTGSRHITFTWNQGGGQQKYGGTYEGIIPKLLTQHREAKSKIKRNQLEKYMATRACHECGGERLIAQARHVMLTTADASFRKSPKRSLPQVCEMSVAEAAAFFQELKLSETEHTIATELMKEVRGRLGFLLNVGLDYLSLARTAPTLSGGESQRIRLAGQVGCGLVGVTYILDEPSIGLHPRDNDRLLDTLRHLRDQGNTVVVVEHDEDTMRAADALIDFGPGPGIRGGRVVGTGTVADLAAAPESVTGQYLSGASRIETPASRRLPGKAKLKIVNARHNNLKGVDVELPLGVFLCITGVSGSGKSSLVIDILSEALHRDLNKGLGEPGVHDRIEGLENLDKLIRIDQSPIGRTPRSNPATYIKVFDDIRKLYVQLPEAKARGYQPGRFSFNVAGGRCEACEGNGSNKLEMDFLADIWVTCPICQGHRFNRETLQVRFKNKSIADVLEMDVAQALEHFSEITPIASKLQTLHDVGLDYLKLGQPSPTLSGGEAQRIKLARELVKRSTGRTLYLLDEPTTGLHFADIHKLIDVLQSFVETGNTVLVIEHNLDVIKTADWLVDIGPEGGAGGGRVVASGPPEHVAEVAESYTGRALAETFRRDAKRGKRGDLGKKAKAKPVKPTEGSRFITVQGAHQHNLKHVDVEIPRDSVTVCCGLSGSGKSSLAMDTIYAEGQRRYIESLSAYARQFVGQMQKPRLENISGLSPAIAIEQKNLGSTPRSTVGTVTEIYDYLRVLFARIGQRYCPECDLPVGTQTSDQIVDKILALPEGSRFYLTAPLEIAANEKYDILWEELKRSGYQRVRIDGTTHELNDVPKIDRRKRHDVEVVVDRLAIKSGLQKRLADGVETALSLGNGLCRVILASDADEPKWEAVNFSQFLSCSNCGLSFEELTPHHYSFNSSLGWCESCEGLGTQTGANPAAMLGDPKWTLDQGALSLWPPLSESLSQAMLKALSTATGIPTDVPYLELTARQRRMLLHGIGDRWIDVPAPKGNVPLLRFQFKGLYPALDEACRVKPALRQKFDAVIDEVDCSSCGGGRLRPDAGATRMAGKTLDTICRTNLGEILTWFTSLKFTPREAKIGSELVREIVNRLRFLVDVGLDYLTLGRSAPTLSGGEAQRIRLASQIGSGLTGVLYVLDEPTIGLHPRDNTRLIKALYHLRDLGNTLLLVEHDREVIASADKLLDFGPGAGSGGGQIVAQGTPKQVSRLAESVTGPYLSGKKAIPVPINRRTTLPSEQNGKARSQKALASDRLNTTVRPDLPVLTVRGARHHNLKHIDVSIPLGTLVAITGVSGSGKSSLVEDVLYRALARQLHRARSVPGAHESIEGIAQIDKVIRVDQQPLGNSPTSTPATYTGLFDRIRELFAQLPESKMRGYNARRFSFNVPGGRCEACEGSGQRLIEMHFLPDVWVECETCRGHRYTPETLAVKFHGKSVADVLEMSCREALELFANIPVIRRPLQVLCDVGLDYLKLGQPAPTLSGGEAQRVKLAAELGRPDTGRTLYLLDEPTTGLHFDDLAKLLEVLHRLVDIGNTVVVIEHNLDVIKTADWLIDIGPEAGAEGGQVVAAGPPEQIVAHANAWSEENTTGNTKRRRSVKKSATETDSPRLRSYTGEALAPVLEAGPFEDRTPFDPLAEINRATDLDLKDLGAEAQMPWEKDGRKWHTESRLSRSGEECRWDGGIVSSVVDRIELLDQNNELFSPTNWNSRSTVEICGKTKSHGWFLHVLTGGTWVVDFKFRVPRGTFKRADLIERLGLKPLDQIPDVPVYGSEPRVRTKQSQGPWQEVQVRILTREEVERAEFWKFLADCVAAFGKLSERRSENPEALMPWKVLGEKWHLSRKGFPLGKTPKWPAETLEKLRDLLQQAAPEGTFEWTNKMLVHLQLAQLNRPWATLITKRPDHIELVLNGPKSRFPLGRIRKLAPDAEVDGRSPDLDFVRLRYRNPQEINGELLAFLQEHKTAVDPAG